MRLTASSYVSDRDVGRARQRTHNAVPEYKTACRAPVRTCTELNGSATSVWVQASPQSELMGPSNAGFALAPCTYSGRTGFKGRLRLLSCNRRAHALALHDHG